MHNLLTEWRCSKVDRHKRPPQSFQQQVTLWGSGWPLPSQVPRHKSALSLALHADAGLGGGSGNAATTLWAANELCGRPASNAELLEVSSSTNVNACVVKAFPWHWRPASSAEVLEVRRCCTAVVIVCPLALAAR